MRSKTIIFIILVSVVAIIIFILSSRSESLIQSIIKSKPSTQMSEKVESNPSSNPTLSDQISPLIELPTALKEFVDQEAAQLETPVKNEQEVVKKYKDQASDLTFSEITAIKQTVSHIEEDIRRRIVSLYLLIQNESPESLLALKDIIDHENFKIEKITAPHTLQDIEQTQNQALFNMAAEAWFIRKLQIEKGSQSKSVFIQNLIQNSNNDRLKEFLRLKLQQTQE